MGAATPSRGRGYKQRLHCEKKKTHTHGKSEVTGDQSSLQPKKDRENETSMIQKGTKRGDGSQLK